MDEEKLLTTITGLRFTKSMVNDIELAARELTLQRVQVIRLAVLAGLPILRKHVSHTLPQDKTTRA